MDFLCSSFQSISKVCVTLFCQNGQILEQYYWLTFEPQYSCRLRNHIMNRIFETPPPKAKGFLLLNCWSILSPDLDLGSKWQQKQHNLHFFLYYFGIFGHPKTHATIPFIGCTQVLTVHYCIKKTKQKKQRFEMVNWSALKEENALIHFSRNILHLNTQTEAEWWRISLHQQVVAHKP